MTDSVGALDLPGMTQKDLWRDLQALGEEATRMHAEIDRQAAELSLWRRGLNEGQVVAAMKLWSEQ